MTDFRTIGRTAVWLSALLAAGSVYAAESQSPTASARAVAPLAMMSPPVQRSTSPSPEPAAPPAETPSPAPAAQPHTWPRVFQEGAETLTMYQPQIEQWDDTSMTFRAAIAVEPAEGAEPIYGMVRTTARADVDKAARIVTLHDFQVVNVTFPTAPERDASYLAILSQHLPTGVKEISLDRLEASAAVSQAVKKQRGLDVDNDPPRILFSTSPALLVLVDGEPVLSAMRAAGSVAAQRVINTHALIVKVGDVFYLTALNYWYQAPAIAGPWSPLADPPDFLAQVRQAASDQVDLMEPETDVAPLAAPPALYVSTVPAELIQTDGEPRFIPIADTGLLQAQNSDDAIFLYGQTGEYFVLISGRWFKSASLDRGPWQFISARELPADFAKIPPDDPRANVLVSVPGTPEAQEALIADSIPQTATVTRGPGTVDLLYDGDAGGAPQFEPIADVPSLQYAPNASLPVIEAAPDSFYCVQNGIWFVGPTPAGPWVVATEVPPAIYSIPPSCPVHYVTYCRIYGFTQQDVYCGYTPGYLGTVVSTDGVVVYGTGYRYRPHVGRVWVAQPCTYGFNAGFACGPDTGFAFGFAEGIFAGGRLEPYWGPYDWGWRHHLNYSHISVNHVDVYEDWHDKVVSIPQRRGRAGAEEKAQSHPQPPFNPYSARLTARQQSPSVAPSSHAPAEHQPTARPAKLDWSANAKPRTRTFAQQTAPVVTAHEPQPKPETHVTAPHTTAPATHAPAAKPAIQQAPAYKPNNVFVSQNGDVYRRTSAPEPATKTPQATRSEPTERPHVTAPATKQEPTEGPHVTAPATKQEPTERPHVTTPATKQEPTERPHVTEPVAKPEPTERPHVTQPVTKPEAVPVAHETPARQPAQSNQWEQHTQSGWKPATQSPTFQKAAPELNREAAARDTGESRTVSRPSTIPAQTSTPIVPSRSSASPGRR